MTHERQAYLHAPHMVRPCNLRLSCPEVQLSCTQENQPDFAWPVQSPSHNFTYSLEGMPESRSAVLV